PSLEAGTSPPKDVPGAQFKALLGQSGGEALGADVRQDMESRLGYDFGDVRVHHDPPARAASAMLNANAFTMGADIYFGAGKYAPGSGAGRSLLAHELTHVVQQANGLQTGVIQRSVDDLVDGLAKRVGKEALDTLRSAMKP